MIRYCNTQRLASTATMRSHGTLPAIFATHGTPGRKEDGLLAVWPRKRRPRVMWEVNGNSHLAADVSINTSLNCMQPFRPLGRHTSFLSFCTKLCATARLYWPCGEISSEGSRTFVMAVGGHLIGHITQKSTALSLKCSSARPDVATLCVLGAASSVLRAINRNYNAQGVFGSSAFRLETALVILNWMSS